MAKEKRERPAYLRVVREREASGASLLDAVMGAAVGANPKAFGRALMAGFVAGATTDPEVRQAATDGLGAAMLDLLSAIDKGDGDA